VRQGVDRTFVHRRGDLGQGLEGLDAYAEAAAFLLGHNIIHFDVRHLEAAKRDLRLLQKPQIDTLWLNPLAFPRNPYHHLVKHYQAGRLQAGHVNDPELDAELALTVLANQVEALATLEERAPATLMAYHYLTTTGPYPAGFDAVFSHVRATGRPAPSEAQSALRTLLSAEACSHQIETVIPEAARDGCSTTPTARAVGRALAVHSRVPAAIVPFRWPFG